VFQDDLTPLAAWLYMAKGMGEYRMGRFEESIKWMTRASDGLKNASAPAGKATADLFLAMGNQKLGKRPEAKICYERAKETIEKLPKAGLAVIGENGVENWLICQTVYREAIGMMGTGAK
jgi:tetratricopeptide (TPR) repeat protein